MCVLLSRHQLLRATQMPHTLIATLLSEFPHQPYRNAHLQYESFSLQRAVSVLFLMSDGDPLWRNRHE